MIRALNLNWHPKSWRRERWFRPIPYREWEMALMRVFFAIVVLMAYPRRVPTADPDRRGGSRVDLGLGLNFKLPMKGHRLAVEAALPVYQDLDGPQLGAEWILTAGWQFAF